ncbi:MAG: Spore protein SP21 [Pseudomonadales bacterium]|nr:Spore protein SP21 [Pseudomonadales bacterium]
MSERKTTEKAAPGAAASETALRPNVEVYEDADGITLIADLPGVAPGGLNLQVDKETLLIEGNADLALPEGLQPLHAEVRSTTWRRSFALSGELDPDGIEARLKDGVLRLHIPKRAEVRPRRIEVRVT